MFSGAYMGTLSCHMYGVDVGIMVSDVTPMQVHKWEVLNYAKTREKLFETIYNVHTKRVGYSVFPY